MLVRRLKKQFAPGRRAALRSGKVVSGRVVAAMGARLLVAPRRRADVERGVPAGRRQRGLRPRRGRRQAVHHDARRPAERRSAARAAGIRGRRGTTCGGNGACRPTSIRWSRSCRTRRSARVSRACSSRDSSGSSVTCCRCAGSGRPTRAGTGKRGRWFFRAEHLFLIPGDSPIGYRLPLDSLPWVRPADYPYIYEQDLHVERPPLPPRQMYLERQPEFRPPRTALAGRLPR